MSIHQGRVLKHEIDAKGYTQEEAAKKMGYSRTNFVRYFKEEKLKEKFLEKVVNTLGIDKQKFFHMENIFMEGNATYNKTGLSGDNIFQAFSSMQDCITELFAAQKELIAEKEKTNQLQQQIIDLLKKQNKGK